MIITALLELFVTVVMAYLKRVNEFLFNTIIVNLEYEIY
jgi:hypothetical protein